MALDVVGKPDLKLRNLCARPFHELVAKLRQETARADVLGESGAPIIVIGVGFTLDQRAGRFAARLGLSFLVEGQPRPLWTAAEVFAALRGTPAEAVLHQLLRAATDADFALNGWQRPADFALDGVESLFATVMGSLTVLRHADGADGWVWTLCLPEGRNEIEALELPLRAASEFRRFRAAQPEAATIKGDVDFSAKAAMPATQD